MQSYFPRAHSESPICLFCPRNSSKIKGIRFNITEDEANIHIQQSKNTEFFFVIFAYKIIDYR